MNMRISALITSVTLGVSVVSARPAAGQITTIPVAWYVGKIEWTDYVTGPYGYSKETVTAIVAYALELREEFGPSRPVEVYKHTVTCHVGFVEVDHGQTTTRSADGPGLFGLSFERNGASSTYQFTVACPNAMYDEPRPAAWSHSMDSYKQPWKPKPGVSSPPDSISGGWRVPNPATDLANGVGGDLSLTWSLCTTLLPQCKRPQPPKSPP